MPTNTLFSTANFHNDSDFVWYPSIRGNAMIFYNGSKFCLSKSYSNCEYFKCTFKQCPSKIVLKMDANDEIIYSNGYFDCFHKCTPKIQLDRRVLYKNLTQSDNLSVTNLKSKYEDELTQMMAVTGNGVSFKSVKERLYNNIATNNRLVRTVDNFVDLLNKAADLHDDKWNVIKIDDKNILFLSKNGLERIKDCSFFGIDGNHKSVAKLKDDNNKQAWNQLVSFVAMYVLLCLFGVFGFFCLCFVRVFGICTFFGKRF